MHHAAEQGHGQPRQVEHGRDVVPVEEQDPERVRDLGVRGVERGQEDRIEEVDLAQVAGLHEPRRERHVVPEAVGAVHAGGERAQGRHHPRRRRARRTQARRSPWRAPTPRARGWRRGRSHGPSAASLVAIRPAARPAATMATSTTPSSNPPKLPSASQTQIMPATASTDLGQPRRSSGPAGQQQGADPVGAEGQRRQAPGRARGRRPGTRRA